MPDLQNAQLDDLGLRDSVLTLPLSRHASYLVLVHHLGTLALGLPSGFASPLTLASILSFGFISLDSGFSPPTLVVVHDVTRQWMSRRLSARDDPFVLRAQPISWMVFFDQARIHANKNS